MSSELRRHHRRNAYLLTSPRRLAARFALAALSVVASTTTACTGGVPSTTSELNSGQAVMDLGALVGELREENSMMQAQIDSLRGALAYQDTIVRQLAAGAGVQVRSPALSTP